MKNLLVITVTMCFLFVCNSATAKTEILKDDEYSCSNESGTKFCVNLKGEPITGKIGEFYPDGKYHIIANLKNGYLNGRFTEYNQDGFRVKRAYYKMSVLNGVYYTYNRNSTLELSANYKDGYLNGRVETYDLDNNLTSRLSYKYGVLEDGYCLNKKGKKEKLTYKQIKAQAENTIFVCAQK